MGILNLCCASSLSENSRRIRAYYRAFVLDNYSKPPEFFNPANLQYFDDFYSAESTNGVQNPVYSNWWVSVTKADIDGALPIKNAMHTYLIRSLA